MNDIYTGLIPLNLNLNLYTVSDISWSIILVQVAVTN